jgi:hypothetical protein
MPVHDWTRVIDGVFHDFHSSWITHLKETLNAGVLPDDYYALAEQVAGEATPDVLTLHVDGKGGSEPPSAGASANGPTVCTLAAAPPQVRFSVEPEGAAYAGRRRRVVIRHRSGDRVVAVVEIVSPGNKSSRNAVRRFVSKAVDLLSAGVHLLVVDLLPPGPRDPRGLHALLWEEIDDAHPYAPPADKPLTLASYRGYPAVRAFIEPVAVGDALRPMPLLLDPESYVNVPLEATYQAAYRGVPRRWREALERSDPQGKP